MFALKYMNSTWNIMVLLKIIFSKAEIIKKNTFAMLLGDNGRIHFYTTFLKLCFVKNC